MSIMRSSSLLSLLFVLLVLLFRECLGQLPHILLMVADDFGWSDIGYHHEDATYSTPSIDRLIETGIELTNYYVHSMCTPTRSAMFTGKYSFKNGLQMKATILCGSSARLPPEHKTLAEILKDTGYTTHMVGKWHLGYASTDYTPTGRGFDSHIGFYQHSVDYYTQFSIFIRIAATQKRFQMFIKFH